MIWNVRLARDAKSQLRKLPLDRQELIWKSLREMADDPFLGDVKRLQGARWTGHYRKRVGRYRVIFVPFHQEHIIEVSAILSRSEKTYR